MKMCVSKWEYETTIQKKQEKSCCTDELVAKSVSHQSRLASQHKSRLSQSVSQQSVSQLQSVSSVSDSVSVSSLSVCLSVSQSAVSLSGQSVSRHSIK